MPAYAILRHGRKLKTPAALCAVSDHNLRRSDHERRPNVEPSRSRSNAILVGSGDSERDVAEYIAALGIKPRRNAVLARELLMTASPEWLRAGGPPGQPADPARVSQWAEAALAWARDEFGTDRVVSAILHNDEATPHVHLIVVPSVQRTRGPRKPRSQDPTRRRQPRAPREVWTLDHDAVFGGRLEMIARQDRHAAALAPLGLARGVSGSRRKHEPLARLHARQREDAAAAAEARATAEREGGATAAGRRRVEAARAAIQGIAEGAVVVGSNGRPRPRDGLPEGRRRHLMAACVLPEVVAFARLFRAAADSVAAERLAAIAAMERAARNALNEAYAQRVEAERERGEATQIIARGRRLLPHLDDAVRIEAASLQHTLVRISRRREREPVREQPQL